LAVFSDVHVAPAAFALRNFVISFRKIGALHVKIAFGNAPAIIKGYHVKIPIFMIEHAYRPIVTQASLEY